MKPKDFKTKHKTGDYIYIRHNGPIKSEYTIRRIQVIKIVITVEEKIVEVHYDTCVGLCLENETSATIEEAEALALAELAAYRLKGGDAARKKKSKPSKKGKRIPARKKSRSAVTLDEEEEDDGDEIDYNDEDDEDEDDEEEEI